MKPLQPYDPDAAALQAASEQFDETELVPFDYDAPRGLAGVGESLKSLALPSAPAHRPNPAHLAEHAAACVARHTPGSNP